MSHFQQQFYNLDAAKRRTLKGAVDFDFFCLLARNIGISDDLKDFYDWVQHLSQDALINAPAAGDANSNDANNTDAANDRNNPIYSSEPPSNYPHKLKDQWARGPNSERNVFKRECFVLCDRELHWPKKDYRRFVGEWKIRKDFEERLQQIASSFSVKFSIFSYPV